MRLLLLSLGTGAVPGFLDATVGTDRAATRIGYIDDAAVPHAGAPFVAAEHAALGRFGAAITDITVGSLPDAEAVAAALAGLDAVYVCGGESFALLAALRRTGGDTVLTALVRAGLPYIGSSAGSIVTGRSLEPLSLMDDPALGEGLTTRDGLGLVDTVVVPHADGALPPYPAPLIDRIVGEYGRDYPLTLLRDDQAVLVDDDGVRIVVSA
ncbi:Type 1 glutamine amidotransferase-like domain-containing protein [Mycetocola reblochoni]|uniref:Alpha-aspartyl dipeptidase Peptidase E n=2 Tax=Mycetocola reblochoni TaxID=331618 RepID=A0A1R4K7Y2_9MICO|nr:Type 1 glutamine amidotransferase-like domain-containing protein [Mycetocola reblochoni]RLP68197.1 peptidase S51 dipeptidase E [Mycetocola reblochoni]SJN40235.1 Alpha-aspartyl dipeptidase Peptidase E [Mycetocola reblochoni REB411]